MRKPAQSMSEVNVCSSEGQFGLMPLITEAQTASETIGTSTSRSFSARFSSSSEVIPHPVKCKVIFSKLGVE